MVQLNGIISNLNNIKNKKISYAKSSGVNIIRKKTLKKVKLITIKFSSGIIKYFPYNIMCIYGSNSNFLVNKIVEGKWGNSLKKKKHINVRGVAKNPVDHPNGGRTKAKQPEYSPWGWVAKHNK